MSHTAYFADTWFWIGLLHEPDQHHKAARAIYKKIAGSQIVTSEMVLAEVLNVFRKFGPRWRTICCDYIDLLRTRTEIVVVVQTSDYFRRGVAKYRKHDDKEWSLVDCTSFLIMEERGINAALTGDRHFAQAGYVMVEP
jgi:predicted nucleic acid-binding protein